MHSHSHTRKKNIFFPIVTCILLNKKLQPFSCAFHTHTHIQTNFPPHVWVPVSAAVRAPLETHESESVANLSRNSPLSKRVRERLNAFASLSGFRTRCAHTSALTQKPTQTHTHTHCEQNKKPLLCWNEKKDKNAKNKKATKKKSFLHF